MERTKRSSRRQLQTHSPSPSIPFIIIPCPAAQRLPFLSRFRFKHHFYLPLLYSLVRAALLPFITLLSGRYCPPLLPYPGIVAFFHLIILLPGQCPLFSLFPCPDIIVVHDSHTRTLLSSIIPIPRHYCLSFFPYLDIIVLIIIHIWALSLLLLSGNYYPPPLSISEHYRSHIILSALPPLIIFYPGLLPSSSILKHYYSLISFPSEHYFPLTLVPSTRNIIVTSPCTHVSLTPNLPHVLPFMLPSS
jgi:hypothetical protein